MSINMKLLPFDSSQRDDSNKLNFIITGSLNTEISLFLDFKIFNSKIMQKLTKTYEILRNFTQVTQVYRGYVILQKFTPKKIPDDQAKIRYCRITRYRDILQNI